MNYLRWTIGQDIAGRFPNRSVTECYTEIDESGRVTREIGVDASGVVVHLAPTPDDPYGLFDNQVIDMVQRRDDIAPEAFERLWRLHDLGL